MRKLLIAAILIASLPAAAYAQGKTPPTVRDESEKKKDAEIDKAYKETMKRVDGNTQPTKPADPWSSIRPTTSSDNSKH
jgi:hypothetical protein